LAAKDLRINNMIRVREVRLIDGEGGQRGIVPITEALRLASEAGLDLVEVSPMAQPPVCKLLDYGKFKYEQEKKTKESNKRQKQLRLKEVRMQPKIDSHDLAFKAKHVQSFLEEGSKVKVTIRFRGRELAHTEIGREVLHKVLGLLEVPHTLERAPLMEGRFMSMFVGPKAKK
jgi:translation initiation factor IF-3